MLVSDFKLADAARGCAGTGRDRDSPGAAARSTLYYPRDVPPMPRSPASTAGTGMRTSRIIVQNGTSRKRNHTALRGGPRAGRGARRRGLMNRSEQVLRFVTLGSQPAG